MGFPGVSVVKTLPANEGDAVLLPGSGRSPAEGSGNPLQYTCLGNPMYNRALWAIFLGVTKESDDLVTEQPSSILYNTTKALNPQKWRILDLEGKI